MNITEAASDDFDATLRIARAAFRRDDEAVLVAALLDDPSARPILSLLAWIDGRPVGHVLYTTLAIGGAGASCPAAILAPLAVLPEVQRRGVGQALIEDGASRLAAAGVRLLFVLGDPAYYTKSGFVPAVPFGLHPPYPVVPEQAWMVRPLVPGVLGTVGGRVSCATSLDRPEYWRE